MPWVALAVQIAFLVVVFPVRAALRHRRDGEAGWADLRASRPRAWVAADVLFLTGMTLLVTGPLLEGLRILAGLATPGPATAALAVVLALAGLTLAVWAQETMGPAWRADIPPGRNARLVTRGPFAVVRNPNYVAMLGVGLATVSLAPGLLTIGGWVCLLGSLLLTARAEEPELRGRYGEEYARYAARVGRFLPGIGRLSAAP